MRKRHSGGKIPIVRRALEAKHTDEENFQAWDFPVLPQLSQFLP